MKTLLVCVSGASAAVLAPLWGFTLPVPEMLGALLGCALSVGALALTYCALD